MHGDVFRPPTAIMLLSVSVSTGTQILIMSLVALVFACLGFLSPPNRGALMTAVLVSLSGREGGREGGRAWALIRVFHLSGVLCLPRLCGWLCVCSSLQE